MENKNIFTDDIFIKRHLKEKNEKEKATNIEYLLNLVRNNPNITEDMVPHHLKKYLGIAKRLYKEECVTNERVKSR